MGPAGPRLPNWVTNRYVPWTSWRAGAQQWGLSSIRQGESSGTITHEIVHTFGIADNNNNPYVTPYHRVGIGAVGHPGPRLVQRPGRPAQALGGAGHAGRRDGGRHDAADQALQDWFNEADVHRVTRCGLASSGMQVMRVQARTASPSRRGS